jgi:hypothetical protein
MQHLYLPGRIGVRSSGTELETCYRRENSLHATLSRDIFKMRNQNTTRVTVNIIFQVRAINPSSLIKIRYLYTSYLCPDKSGRQVPLSFISLNFRAVFKLDLSPMLPSRILGTGPLL